MTATSPVFVSGEKQLSGRTMDQHQDQSQHFLPRLGCIEYFPTSKSPGLGPVSIRYQSRMRALDCGAASMKEWQRRKTHVFYSILFYYIRFYSTLLYSILFYSIIFYYIICCYIILYYIIIDSAIEGVAMRAMHNNVRCQRRTYRNPV